MTLDIDAVRVATYAVIAKICAEDTLEYVLQPLEMSLCNGDYPVWLTYTFTC